MLLALIVLFCTLDDEDDNDKGDSGIVNKGGVGEVGDRSEEDDKSEGESRDSSEWAISAVWCLCVPINFCINKQLKRQASHPRLDAGLRTSSNDEEEGEDEDEDGDEDEEEDEEVDVLPGDSPTFLSIPFSFDGDSPFPSFLQLVSL